MSRISAWLRSRATRRSPIVGDPRKPETWNPPDSAERYVIHLDPAASIEHIAAPLSEMYVVRGRARFTRAWKYAMVSRCLDVPLVRAVLMRRVGRGSEWIAAPGCRFG